MSVHYDATDAWYCGAVCVYNTQEAVLVIGTLKWLSQLVKKFPAFYGARRFFPAFTSSRQLSLSWACSTQSMSPHPTFWRSILILSSHLCHGLPNGLFPSGFPTKPQYRGMYRGTAAINLIGGNWEVIFTNITEKQVFEWGIEPCCRNSTEILAHHHNSSGYGTFKVCRYVHHHTLQIDHQLDAKISPIFYLKFIYS